MLVLVILMCSVKPMNVFATETPATEFSYWIDNNEVTISKYRGNSPEVIIPLMIGEYPVAHIGDEAFQFSVLLSSVIIPNSVTSIGNNTFYFSSLTNIVIPDSVTSIGNHAFANSSLKNVIIPDSVTNIGYSAFWECSSLTSITLSNSMTSIENSTFRGCSSLKSVIIPDSVTSIGSGSFEECKSLTSITIPQNLSVIKHSTFSNCSSLETVNIPSSVTDIEEGAFDGCKKLKYVYYDGSENDWNKIVVGNRNINLENAEIHFEEQNNTETPTDATEKPIVNTDKQVENKENTNSKLVKKSKDSTKTIHLTIALVVSNCLWAIVMVVVVIVLRKKRT